MSVLQGNGDGFADLIAHYRMEEAGIASGHIEACVSGKTIDCEPFEGCDAVRTVPEMDGDMSVEMRQQPAATRD